MQRRLIAFDLDGTLAVTKSAISDAMSVRLRDLLARYEVCIISGGAFEQFDKQVIEHLGAGPELLAKLHIMPTSGTRYLRFDPATSQWVVQYSEDLTPQQRARIIDVLTEGAKSLGYWETDPHGEIVEDRGSQITYSALGQQAPPDAKYAWDADGEKKEALRSYAAQRLTDLEVHAGGTTSIDVTGPGIDKAYGMNKLMAILGLSKPDILFMGDKLEPGGNDYPVKALGIDTIAVDGWEQCAIVIQAIVAVAP
ncbi:MAG: HAD-IIB family hydrolase [Ilumatobacteraceae bacterium]